MTLIFNFKTRLLLFTLGIVFFVTLFYIGYLVKLDKSFSEELSKNFKHQIRDIDELGIFFNNVKIALSMFIPIVGIIVGSFSAFSTGLVFNSIMNLSGVENFNPLIVFLTPFGILELMSYGLALSRGGILFYEITKKIITKRSLMYLFLDISLVCLMLFIGAIIEWNIIENTPDRLNNFNR
jgi:hypothetical protein